MISINKANSFIPHKCPAVLNTESFIPHRYNTVTEFNETVQKEENKSVAISQKDVEMNKR